MRILFLHEVNYLSKPIFEMHEFPEHIAKLGHEVAFVQFPEGLTQTQIRDIGYRRKISGRVLRDVQIDLITPWTISGGLVGRLLTAFFAYWQFKKILRDYRPDIVVCFSVPTSGWQALMASRQARVPFVFRALDVSHKIRKGTFSGLVRVAEKFIYRHCDAISANNPAMLTYCQALSGRSGMAAVHNPPLDLAAFARGDRAKGRLLLGLSPGEKVILYMGSFFYFSGLPDAIRVLSEVGSTEKLVLVGGGEQDEELRNLSSQLAVSDKVIFTGMVPYSDLPDLLSAADVAINPMEKTLVSDAALPNKVLQYMACGVPVVSTSLNGLVATFGFDSGITWGTSPRDVMSLAVNLVKSEDLPQLSTSGSRAIETFKSQSDPRKFEAYLQQVVAEK